MPQKSDENSIPLYFSLFNEIGIIDQLSSSAVDDLMPKTLMHSHFGVLNHLTRLGDGSTPLELANAFQVAKTTMTNTLSGLEKHNLVSIKPNPNDGRSKQVWLTPAGDNLRLQIIEKLAPTLANILGGFSASHIESIVNDLAKIRKLMDAQR